VIFAVNEVMIGNVPRRPVLERIDVTMYKHTIKVHILFATLDSRLHTDGKRGCQSNSSSLGKFKLLSANSYRSNEMNPVHM
jgi:hypothetical protein